MMTCIKYFNQATFNHEAARSTKKHYPDWAITMCFYTALHMVEYYAHLKGIDFGDYEGKSPHDRRRKYVYDLASELNNRSLIKAYNDLEKESKKSRYLENLNETSRDYYKNNETKVTKAFLDLHTISCLLSI
jgi:hypothetical protein